MTSTATTKLDWDNDVIKHFIRREIWLPAALAQANTCRDLGREPKYLTFCAAEAIDVFLFLKNGILARDPLTNYVMNAYFCEKDPQDFAEITRLVGSQEQGFLGDFLDIVLFADDEETQGKKLDDIEARYPRELRNRLSTKARHQRLRAAVPFDVINLDICGVFFPPRAGVLSPMLTSIRTLLDWQTDSVQYDHAFGSFTLFLTAHVESGRVNKDAIDELISMVANNRSAYAGFSEALEQRFGTSDPKAIATTDFDGFYCTALSKVVVSEAFQRGWMARVPFSGLYRRTRQTNEGVAASEYSMLAWTCRFERQTPHEAQLGLPQTPRDSEYAILIGQLAKKPVEIDIAAQEVHDEVQADLSQVVSSREEYVLRIQS